METKAITPSFAEKGAAASPAENIQNNLLYIEDIFTACNEKLASVEMSGISYSTQCGTIGKVIEDMIALQCYATSAHAQVQEELDGPLFEDFSLNATETISRIKLEDITTDNTFKMEEYTTTVDAAGVIVYQTQIKASLNMYDFLDIPESGPIGSPVLKNVETISEFASLFQQDYDTMKETLGWDVDTCIEIYMTSGEFDHKMHQPIKSLISNILDITIVKPFIESLTGNEWITGEDLTDTERDWKMTGAIIDFVTMGYGCVARKAAGYTAKEAAGALAKDMVEDMVANAGICTVDHIGTELGISPEINWILSVTAGCTVSMMGSNFVLMFDDIGGTPVTKKLKPNEFQDFLENEVSKILKNNTPDLDNLDTTALKNTEGLSDLEAISVDGIDGLKKVTSEGGTPTSRPTWRQSELDAATDFPDYDAQKSFINGEEVPYGTKGSVRPDYYKDGFSVDIKNYNVESASGRSNLARNIEKQYYQRIENLPDGTKQSVMIDVRGQNVSDEALGALYDDIMRRTNNGVEILFKMD